MTDELAGRLAARLKLIRQGREWSLDQLAEMSGVSRASLSRLENAETSPTTDVLGKLCAAFGLTQSRLLAMVEEVFDPFIPHAAQSEWQDTSVGFTRRVISPPARSLMGEVIRCELTPGAHIDYDRPTIEGLEHHLIMLAGGLSLTVNGEHYNLSVGDCLRYELRGATRFVSDACEGACYLMVQIGGNAVRGANG